jgi:nucleoside-diphosphate-sugar epimerase
MKAFVTGASGFIGTHLVEALLKNNWKVNVLLHKQGMLSEEKCGVFRGNLLDFDTLREALQGTDILFHLAAALGASLIPEREFFRINAEGTETVLRAAQEAEVKKIIHFSSAGVLGFVAENKPMMENHSPAPIAVYDKTKLEGERIALKFAQEGVDVVVVRPGWVYGPGDKRTLKLIRAIAKKRFLLVTKGTARQTPVFIDDLIQGILLCADQGQRGEIYHLAGPQVLSVRDIVTSIGEVAGVKVPRLTLPLFPVKLAATLLGKAFTLFGREAPLTEGKLSFFIHPKPLSIAKAKRKLGYKPQTAFKKGIEQTISWYKHRGWL